MVRPAMNHLSSLDPQQQPQQAALRTPPRQDPSRPEIRSATAVFLLLGIGSLLPWNAFISSEPYFESRLCHDSSSSNNNNNNGSSIISSSSSSSSNNNSDDGQEGTKGANGSNVELWFGLVFNLAGVLALGCMILASRRTEQRDELERIRNATNRTSNDMDDDDELTDGGYSDSGSNITEPLLAHDEPEDADEELRKRDEETRKERTRQRNMVVMPLGFFLVVLLITTVLVTMKDLNQHVFLMTTLAGMAVCGVSNAVAGAGIVTASGIFPPHIGINAYISGQAVGGLAASLANFMAAILKEPQMYWKEHCPSSSPGNASSSTSLHHIIETTTTTTTSELFLDLQHQDIITRLLEDHSGDDCPAYIMDWGAFVYFALASGLLGLCMVGYLYLDQSAVAEYYRKESEGESLRQQLAESEQVKRRYAHYLGESTSLDGSMAAQEEEERWVSDMVTELQSPERPGRVGDPRRQTHRSKLVQLFLDRPLLQPTPPPPPSRPSSLQIQESYLSDGDSDGDGMLTSDVFWAIRYPAASIYITIFITLIIFPAWTSTLRSVHQCHSMNSSMSSTHDSKNQSSLHNRLANDLFVPLTFVLYNAFDLVGRLVGERIPLANVHNVPKKLFWVSLGRFLFLPIFWCCYTGSSDDGGGEEDASSLVPMHFHSDVAPMLWIALLGLSNGAIFAIGFMQSPKLLPTDSRMQEIASTIMNFAIGFGLLCGSCVSFLYVFLGTHQW